MDNEIRITEIKEEIDIDVPREYTQFIQKLETAEKEGRLPYQCQHCDFTTSLISGVFFHLADNCAGRSTCDICGKRCPDVFHYQQHGFDCLIQKKAYKCDLDRECCDFMMLVKEAEMERKLPFVCLQCKFEAHTMTEVFSHRTQDCKNNRGFLSSDGEWIGLPIRK